MKTKIKVPVEGVRRNRRGWWLGLGLALLPGLVGCTTPNRARSPVPGAAVLNVPLGTVGIIATSTVSGFRYQRPRQKGITADGQAWAEKGFWLGMDRQSFQGGNEGALAFAVPMVAGLVIGTIAGMVHDTGNAVTGVSQKRLAVADASMDRFISETRFQEVLCASVGAEVRRRMPLPVTVVKKPFPQGQEKEFSKMSCIMAGTLAWLPPGQTPRGYLEGQAIDTVLEIRVHEHGLRGKPGSNPNLRLVADVEARLIRLQDGAELYRCRMNRQGTARKYTDWTEDDARALRSETAACCQSLAQQIVEEMLPAPKEPVAGGDPQLKGDT